MIPAPMLVPIVGAMTFPGQGLQEHDGLGFLRFLVPDEYLLARPDVLIDELIQCDRAVHEIRLGQGGPVMKELEVISSLRDQGDRDAPA